MHGEGKKSKTVTVALACAYIFVTLYVLIKLPALSSFFSTVLSVVSPIILGAAIAYILNPLLKLFEFKILKRIKNQKVLRGLSLLFTYITAVLIVVVGIALILPSVLKNLAHLRLYFGTYLGSTVQYLNALIVRLTDNTDFEAIISVETIAGIIAKFFNFSGNLFDTVMNYLAKYGPAVISFLKNLLLGLFISVYILISKERLKAQFRKLSFALFRTSTRKKVVKYIRTAHRALGNFFVGKIIDSFIIFFICLILFSIAGIRYAPLISLIIGVANIIPIFGPFIGAIPSFFIIFTVDIRRSFVFLILILIIYIIDGHVIAPKILGESTGISSLSVIVAIVIGSYFGVVGMIAAIPVFATLTAIIRDLTNARLKKNDLPTDSADYYASDSLVDPHEEHETISHRLFRNIKSLTLRLTARPSKNRKAKSSEDKQENNENEKETEDNND